MSKSKEMDTGKEDPVCECKCPYAQEHEKSNIVMVNSDVWTAIRLLTQEVSSEWFGYLYGKEENGTVWIDKVEVPEQEVSGASADPVVSLGVGVIGWVHSHSDMRAFFSDTDNDTTSNGFKVAIVLNKEGECLVDIRKKLPCGLETTNEGKVEVFSNVTNAKTFVEESKTKLKEKAIEKISMRGFYRGFNPVPVAEIEDDWRYYVNSVGTQVDVVEDNHSRAIYTKACPIKKVPETCSIKDYTKCKYFWSECPYQKRNLKVPMGTF